MCAATRFRSTLSGLAFALALLTQSAPAQPTNAELVTSGLHGPIGATTNAQGHVWVAETGTSPTADDGRISVVLPDGQVFPFLTGIPTGTSAIGSRRSVSRVLHVGDDLWFTAAVSDSESYLHRISTAGWAPGDPPRAMTDVAETVDVGSFVISDLGADDTDPFSITLGPDGALYFTDGGANMVLRYDPATSALSELVTFPDLPNPEQQPSYVDVVPSGIVAADGRLYVATLAGRSQPVEGLARVYAVEFDGTFAIHHDSLTALVELALDPRDGTLTTLQLRAAEGTPGTGRVIRLADGLELASGFHLPRGMAYDDAGTLYVATAGGSLYRVDAAPVGNGPAPATAGLALHSAYPNPSRDLTTLAFELAAPAAVRLAVYDVLGREVAVLVNEVRSAGRHEVVFDPRRAGIPSGVYAVSLSGAGAVLSRRMTLVR